MHHVYKQPRGKYWWAQVRHEGKRHRFSCKTTSKKEAQKIAADYYHRLLNDRVLVERTFGEALDKYEQSAPASMAEKIPYLYELRPFLLKNIPAAAHDLRDELLAEGYSPCTINRRLAVVRRVLNLAFNEWNWLEHPLKKIQLVSEKGTEREVYLTHEEVHQLAMGMDEPYRTILLVSAYTGLRRGNVIGLTRANLDKPNLVFRSRSMKGRKAHSVPLPDFLWARLEDVMLKPDVVKMNGSDRVWAIDDHGLEYAWRKTREDAGLQHVQYRDLRHTFASWLAKDSEIPLTLIRDMLNHSSVLVTNKYMHLRRDDMQIATNKLNGRLEKIGHTFGHTPSKS